MTCLELIFALKYLKKLDLFYVENPSFCPI